MSDVLSGRGAWFNQHPGNKHFRRMLEEQKAVYMAGTKKQKMDISKAIVEAIYLKTPPGRFLKKCPDTGQWNELSRREAADRAAQAMAYVIKGESLKEKRRQRRSRLPDQPTNSHSEGNNHSSSSVAHHGLTARLEGAVDTNNDVQSATASELLRVPEHIKLQQQLLLQQLRQTSTTNLPTSVDNHQLVNQNGSGQSMFQSLQQQHLQQQQQQQLPLQYTMGQNPFGIQTHIGLTPQMLHQAQQLQLQHNEQQQQLLRRYDPAECASISFTANVNDSICSILDGASISAG
eukprot:scaffold6855_cov216-Skeletonema_dohrnii-CCMP3373.AAC.4